MVRGQIQLTVVLLCLVSAGALTLAEPMELRSSDLILRFQGPDAGFDIASVQDASNGTHFMDFAPDPEFGKLWEIELRANGGRGEPLDQSTRAGWCQTGPVTRPRFELSWTAWHLRATLQWMRSASSSSGGNDGVPQRSEVFRYDDQT